MNDNYKWNGISFRSKGIVIEKVPIVAIPIHSFTEYKIPGRNGTLVEDDKTFNTVSFSLQCHFDENNVVDINEIRKWLQGYGTLQLDDEKVYTGRISNTISFEKITNFRKFVIQFQLQPIARALTKTTVTSTSSFTADTYMDSYPIITLTASGNVTVILNDVTFTLSGASGTYVLDCEAKVITQNGSNASSIMSGDFPRVISGGNSLSVVGTVTGFTIEYYKTFI